MVIEIAQVIQDFAIIIIVVYRTTHFFSLHYLFLHYHHLERSHKSYHLLTVNRKTSNTSLRLLVYRMYKTEASTGLFLIYILVLSCLSTSIFSQHNQTLAQQYIQTIKYRNLVIDLGNGVKTNAQLTYPAVGKGPFPGVLLREWC